MGNSHTSSLQSRISDNYTSIDHILEKLERSKKYTYIWRDWTVEEKKKLLETYLVISEKEAEIFDLICLCTGSDTWDNIFRDYTSQDLHDKVDGIEYALAKLEENV